MICEFVLLRYRDECWLCAASREFLHFGKFSEREENGGEGLCVSGGMQGGTYQKYQGASSLKYTQGFSYAPKLSSSHVQAQTKDAR